MLWPLRPGLCCRRLAVPACRGRPAAPAARCPLHGAVCTLCGAGPSLVPPKAAAPPPCLPHSEPSPSLPSLPFLCPGAEPVWDRLLPHLPPLPRPPPPPPQEQVSGAGRDGAGVLGAGRGLCWTGAGRGGAGRGESPLGQGWGHIRTRQQRSVVAAPAAASRPLPPILHPPPPRETPPPPRKLPRPRENSRSTALPPRRFNKESKLHPARVDAALRASANATINSYKVGKNWYGGGELLPQGRCGRHIPPARSAAGAESGTGSSHPIESCCLVPCSAPYAPLKRWAPEVLFSNTTLCGAGQGRAAGGGRAGGQPWRCCWCLWADAPGVLAPSACCRPASLAAVLAPAAYSRARPR